MIELIFTSVTIQSDQIQEQFPFLVDGMGEYLPAHKTRRKRKSKEKQTVGSLINQIIDSIEEKQLCSE